MLRNIGPAAAGPAGPAATALCLPVWLGLRRAAGCVHLCRVAGNSVWSHVASDTPYLWDGVPLTAVHYLYLLK